MREYNKTILVGMLKDKSRNMDNPELKRPLVDFETVYAGKNGVTFVDIGVIMSDNSLARAVSGMHIGELYQISGMLISDTNEDEETSLLINPFAIHRVVGKEALPSLLKSRAELLNWGDDGNSTVFTGTVTSFFNGRGEIYVKRNPLVRGDLKEGDNIPVEYDDGRLKEGDTILCTGKICDGYVRINTIKGGSDHEQRDKGV